MKILTLSQFRDAATPEMDQGRKGWTKGKCIDDNCNTITVWNSKSNGLTCNNGKCGKCGSLTKRTVWSTTANYIIQL